MRRSVLLDFLKVCDELPHFTLEDVHHFGPRHGRKGLCLCNAGRACRCALSNISAQRSDILSKELLRLALQLLQNAHLVATLRIVQRLGHGVEQRLSGHFTLKELLEVTQIFF